ncbi:hypothetical protein GCM10007989_13500 [Devosia pacifica]|uniref:Uncharacterized protein n=1 Tax=Devosia pacifica TaxID=1335967 RepID=A0A918S1I6_9HYPH|nr:hypothetical protein [Devosia pacifica]GHA19292.1 hypothetical protein GCM10007989_13500 [Devosia pacifica]
MLDIIPEISFGQIATLVITLGTGAGGIAFAYVKFRPKTEVSLKSVKEQIVDTNKRVTDLAAGTSTTKTELAEFKTHVERHYVEKNELGEMRVSVDRSIDRMQTSLDLATATMGDVRDAVIALTSSRGKTTVPPQRRRSKSES